MIDYHDQDWPAQVRALTAKPRGGRRGQRGTRRRRQRDRAVADGGRLATITSDPPSQQRGITVSSIYVRPDGNQLRELAKRFADGQLEIPVAASYRLADAAQALAQGTAATPPAPSSSRPDPTRVRPGRCARTAPGARARVVAARRHQTRPATCGQQPTACVATTRPPCALAASYSSCPAGRAGSARTPRRMRRQAGPPQRPGRVVERRS